MHFFWVKPDFSKLQLQLSKLQKQISGESSDETNGLNDVKMFPFNCGINIFLILELQVMNVLSIFVVNSIIFLKIMAKLCFLIYFSEIPSKKLFF